MSFSADGKAPSRWLYVHQIVICLCNALNASVSHFNSEAFTLPLSFEIEPNNAYRNAFYHKFRCTSAHYTGILKHNNRHKLPQYRTLAPIATVRNWGCLCLQ